MKCGTGCDSVSTWPSDNTEGLGWGCSIIFPIANKSRSTKVRISRRLDRPLQPKLNVLVVSFSLALLACLFVMAKSNL